MPAEREALVVRYHPAVAAVILVVGVASTVLALLAALRGDPAFVGVIGLLFLLLGTLMLVRPYFRVGPDAVELVAMIGIGGSEYPYRRLEVADGKLTAVRADRTRERVPVQRWFSRPGDWAAMATALDRRDRALGG